MPENIAIENHKFSGAAHYRIIVEGELDARWSDRLAGLDITQSAGKDARPLTILTGKIRDQAELNGVLESLYGLHLPIVRLEKVEREEIHPL